MSMSNRKTPLLAGSLLIISILACNINTPNPSQVNLELTITAQALSIQQTSQAQAQPAQAQPVVVITETPAQAPAPADTIVAPSATPQSPTMINSTLCWLGPGDKYEVVSSLSKTQPVEVIGRGSVSGWLIIRNPIYNDPCWVQATDLQLDASFDVNALQVYDPPALPTKTPKPTPVPSATPV